MPNNPLIEAFMNIMGSQQTGQGLLSPQNIMDAIKLTGQQYTGQAPLEPSAGMPGSPVQMPSVDLGRINVPVPQQPQMPPPPMNIASPMENVALAGQQGQQRPQGNGINWQMLMDIGIPALSAIIGTAAPGTLAAASGLSTGYTEAREKQREAERKKAEMKDFILIDPKTGEKQTFRVPSEATVQQVREDPYSFLDGLKLDIPETKTGESLKSNKIKVRDLGTGQTGTIDSDEFDSSLYEKL